MTTCKQPDRDTPKLVCGYPLPCPHHTAVLDLAELEHGERISDNGMTSLERALANLRFWGGRVSLSTYFLIAPAPNPKPCPLDVTGGLHNSVLRVVVRAWWARDRGGVGTSANTKELVRELPIDATVVEIRNAVEELQIEGYAWIEEHYAQPAFPVRAEEVEQTEGMALAASVREGIGPLVHVVETDEKIRKNAKRRKQRSKSSR